MKFVEAKVKVLCSRTLNQHTKDSEALIFSRLNDLRMQKLLSMATKKALVVCGAYAALFSLKKKMEQDSKSDQASLTSSERTLLR